MFYFPTATSHQEDCPWDHEVCCDILLGLPSCLSVCLSSLPVFLFVCLVCLCFWLSTSLPVFLSSCLPVCLSVSVYLLYLFSYLSFLSVCVTNCLRTSLPVVLPACLSVCLSVCLSFKSTNPHTMSFHLCSSVLFLLFLHLWFFTMFGMLLFPQVIHSLIDKSFVVVLCFQMFFSCSCPFTGICCCFVCMLCPFDRSLGYTCY